MLNRSAFRKSLLFSALSLLISAPIAYSDVAPVSVSSVQSAANTGAATTSIPIDVPPGRKGIQPNLALTYNSNSPNGWLGVGWGLDMGAIQRSTKRGVNYNSTSTDFVANGVELVSIGGNEYRAKIEGAFSRYYYNGSSNGWVVTTKDGTRYYYGQTPASQQDSALGVFKWCLDKVVDTNGNYMTVSYIKDQGEIYLDRIEYTGNGSINPTNYVQFSREPRADVPAMYGTNSLVKTADRLKTIETSENGQLAGKIVLSYGFNDYTTHTLLTSVTRYGYDGATALPATTFNWLAGGNGSFGSFSSPGGPGFFASMADVNGDGRADLIKSTSGGSVYVYLSKGDGTFYTFLTTEGPGVFAGMADVNGDGRADLIKSDSGGTVYVFLSKGDGTFNSFISTGGPGVFSGMADVNGDGRADLIKSNSGGTIYVFLSNGDGTFSTFLTTDGPGVFASMADVNGDGRDDLIKSNSGGTVYVFLSKGDGTFNAFLTTDGPGVFGSMADVNGDGRVDLIKYNSDGWVYVLLAKGDGTFNSFISTGGPGVFTSMADVNGDGRADLIKSTSGGTVYVFPSKGDGTFNTFLTTDGPGIFAGMGDASGDGGSDLIKKDSGGNVYVFLAQGGGTPDRLSTLTNGLGATTTITYKPSSSYTNGLLPFVVQTVASIAVVDGNGTTSTTNYTYSGGYYEAAEREFRGFGYVKATAPSGTTTETSFYTHEINGDHGNIYKGLPNRQIIKDSSGNTYAETLSGYQFTTPYTGVNFPYLYQKDDYIYDGGTTYKRIATGFTYDSYGNINKKIFYGDADILGDERYEFTDFTPTSEQEAAWLVALPKEIYISTDADGNNKVSKVTFGYSQDTKGNLLTETRWLSGGTNPVVTYTYDSYGNRTSVKDAKNNTTTITYDTTAQTYPVTITNALGHAASKTYDYRYGKPLTETDANGNVTSYAYDVFGRVTTATGPLDTGSTCGTVAYYYQNFGTVGSQKVTTYRTEQSGTSNVIWEESYFDGLGRTFKTRREGPDNKVIVQQNTFDQRGLVTAKSLPYFEGIETARWTTFTYDPVGRVTQATNPDATYATTTYDKGRTTIINANGQKKVEEKDAWGRLVKVEEYNGSTLYATTQYQYDTLGNLTGTTDAKGNQSVIAYDTLGRKTSMTDPDMGSWSYGYDANGNLTTQTDAKGQTITFAYDALNRITLKDYPAGAGTDAVYTYDETSSTNGEGRLTKLVDASGTSKYYYDKLGRTIKSEKTIDTTAYTTETTYDALSRITSVKYPDNETVTYSYDTGGNLSQITGYGTYAGYNALGQAGTITYANGVTTTYQYLSTNNRLYSITTATATQGLMNTSYAYDNVGNITGITDYLDTGRNQTFQYDHLNRLTQAASTAYGTLGYSYNEIGNMTSKEGVIYTYPANGSVRPHAVTSTSDGKSYTYDNNGNMLNDGQRTIAYDYDNMPSSITSGASTISFVYDASGQRVKRIAPSGTTIYVSKLYECGSGGACTKYIMAGGNKVAWKNSIGTFYYHQDHLGSSRVITSASGAVQETIFYKPFGEAASDNLPTGSVLSNTATEYGAKHKFTSQEFDAETGLYYYNARYYNPGLGRFVSADSIVPGAADPQALNRYSYVRNNPLIYVDPTGRSWVSKGLRSVINTINKGIDGVLNKLNIEVSDTEVRASYNTNGETTVSTPSGSWQSGGSGSAGGSDRQDASRSGYGSNGYIVMYVTCFSGAGCDTTGRLREAVHGLYYNRIYSGDGVYGYWEDDIYSYLDKLANSKSLEVNPTKAFSAAMNAVNAGRLYAAGSLKLAAAAGINATGIGAPVGIGTAALGSWNIYSASTAQRRALIQWNEAINERWIDASWSNLLGVLPYGERYDDPWEPTPGQFMKDEYNRLGRNPRNPWEWLKEVGTIAP